MGDLSAQETDPAKKSTVGDDSNVEQAPARPDARPAVYEAPKLATSSSVGHSGHRPPLARQHSRGPSAMANSGETTREAPKPRTRKDKLAATETHAHQADKKFKLSQPLRLRNEKIKTIPDLALSSNKAMKALNERMDEMDEHMFDNTDRLDAIAYELGSIKELLLARPDPFPMHSRSNSIAPVKSPKSPERVKSPKAPTETQSPKAPKAPFSPKELSP